ncbi:MAG: pyridoxal-phosphate dependent enzyme [Candidatus Latescibacterota bacterium]|nr:pyridoxal-phosphate dependent enzyme [Candidatus Latescibacterota bacterium]
MTLVSHSGERYSSADLRWRSDSGALLDLEFTPRLHTDRLSARSQTMWRYREIIPIENDAHVVTFDEGFTPLTPHIISGKAVLLKQDHLFPTGSYKDRGAAVLISHAKALGVDRVVEDSSGNAGAAIAAYCARADIQCDIYVPEITSPAKLKQISSYGAKLHLIPGSREDTADAALRAAEESFYASHVWNPYFFHGTKTFAYEVWEQLNFSAPDEVLIPTGNGTLLIGAHIGFSELLAAGLIDGMPRLIGVQAENCCPLFQMWNQNLDQPPIGGNVLTQAEGIAIAAPARAKQIVDIIQSTRGEVITVNENEIRSAHEMMNRSGWFVEPTSASAIAAATKIELEENRIIIVPLTGHGLKSAGKQDPAA